MGFAPFDEDYPWDSLIPYRKTAAEHPGGVVDLSIGTPVDPTPAALRDALAAAANAPGYPSVAGTGELRRAMVQWWARRRGACVGEDGVLPTIGSKELVGLLPSMLGLGKGDVVVVPTFAYPTYEVGAKLAGAEVLVTDDPAVWGGNERVRLVWVNSPSNPTGAVIPAEALRRVIGAARAVGAVVAADECYAQLPWAPQWGEAGVPSLLADAVTGGDHTGLLAAYSLSKQSNLAGYRAAFVAGDPGLIGKLSLLRRHLGMMVPAPVQAAMIAALSDDAHVSEQRAVYERRRETLVPALRAAGFVIDHSEAGLYLWVRREGSAEAASGQGECWGIVEEFARRGIVVGPGAFYGAAARNHVRISLTETDDRVGQAADRLVEG